MARGMLGFPGGNPGGITGAGGWPAQTQLSSGVRQGDFLRGPVVRRAGPPGGLRYGKPDLPGRWCSAATVLGSAPIAGAGRHTPWFGGSRFPVDRARFFSTRAWPPPAMGGRRPTRFPWKGLAPAGRHGSGGTARADGRTVIRHGCGSAWLPVWCGRGAERTSRSSWDRRCRGVGRRLLTRGSLSILAGLFRGGRPRSRAHRRLVRGGWAAWHAGPGAVHRRLADTRPRLVVAAGVLHQTCRSPPRSSPYPSGHVDRSPAKPGRDTADRGHPRAR